MASNSLNPTKVSIRVVNITPDVASIPRPTNKLMPLWKIHNSMVLPLPILPLISTLSHINTYPSKISKPYSLSTQPEHMPTHDILLLKMT